MEKEINIDTHFSSNFPQNRLTCNSNTEFINQLENEFYLNRNFDYCMKEINGEFEKLRSKESNNRHKCLRNPLCNCVYYGKFLIEIFNHNQEEYAKQFENYYYCCPIYLPFELFISIINHMLNHMEFSTARVWIEAYLTYSSREDPKLSMTYAKNSNKLSLSNREQFELIDLLIFKIVLIKEGFRTAEAKIKTFKFDNEITEKILEKLSQIEKDYSKIPEDKSKSNEKRLRRIEEREKRINDFIDNKIKSDIGNKTNKYSDFLLKGSFMQLLCRMLINKKTIIISLLIFTTIIINSFFKKFIFQFKLKLENVTFIRKMIDFLKGLLSLLVNS